MEQNKKNGLNGASSCKVICEDGEFLLCAPVERTVYMCQVIYPDGTKSCIFECPNKKSLRNRMKELEDSVERFFLQHGWYDCDTVRSEFVCPSYLLDKRSEITVFITFISGYRLLDGDVIHSMSVSIRAWL